MQKLLVRGGRPPEFIISVPSACQTANPESIVAVPTVKVTFHKPVIGSLSAALTSRNSGETKSFSLQACRFSVVFPPMSPHPAYAVAVIVIVTRAATTSAPTVYKESQSEYERGFDLQHDPATKAAAHQTWITGGEPAVERWGAKNIKALARKQYFQAEFVATIIAFTGDKDETMKYLEASHRMHDPDLIFLQNEPVFDFLHSDPRYQALVKKIGLPPVQCPGGSIRGLFPARRNPSGTCLLGCSAGTLEWSQSAHG